MILQKVFKFLVVFIGGLIIGVLIGNFLDISSDRGFIIRRADSAYPLINPILSCEILASGEFSELSPLYDQFKDAIAEKTVIDPSVITSIYFRGLNSGRWIALNGNEQFHPASLLKVIVAMAHYRFAEDRPGHLDEELLFSRAQNRGISQQIPVEQMITTGTRYTIRELIRRMIIFSDNQPLFLLAENIPLDELKRVYDDLGILVSNKDDPRSITVSPRTYSLVFRALYGSTYLNNHDSNELLDILGKTSFDKGLIAGVPVDITVSHKFGISRPDEIDLPGVAKTEDRNELHDCGIIYYPDHPYFLCVMTKGDNLDSLNDVISRASDIAYKWTMDFWGKVR